MTRPRWVEIALIAVIVPLGIWAWRADRERAGLETALARSERAAGGLKVTDPTKVLVRAVKAEGAMRFAWGMYLPKNLQMINTAGREWLRIDGGFDGRQLLLRLDIIDEGPKGFAVYARAPGAGGGPVWANFGDGSLTDLLRGRPDKIIVEQAGTAVFVTADPTQPVVLLRLRLADALRAEAATTLSAEAKALGPTFYEFRLLPDGYKP